MFYLKRFILYVSVSYVERGRNHRWRCVEVTFTCPDGALCQHWVNSIREQLAVLSTTSLHKNYYTEREREWLQ